MGNLERESYEAITGRIEIQGIEPLDGTLENNSTALSYLTYKRNGFLYPVALTFYSIHRENEVATRGTQIHNGIRFGKEMRSQPWNISRTGLQPVESD